jgi:hypothetical protein
MIHAGRHHGKIEGDFVVFLIGARFNKPWKFWRWIPFLPWMPKMLKWLEQHKSEGLLHTRQYLGFGEAVLIQYWRSAEQLEKFASNARAPHLPGWNWYNRAIQKDGTMGIWHETYVVKAGCYEAIYVNMPRYGLGKAGELLKIGAAAESMRQRLDS